MFSTLGLAANTGKLQVANREQAVQLIKQQYPGKVLKVVANQVNEPKGYQIKVISDKGVIFYLDVDAVTGLVIRK